MCGIVGGWFNDPDACRLRSALATIAHRGPDGEGVFGEGGMGFAAGHRRLAIIDLSPTGAQPMVSDDGDVVLVFNGEIYNYRQLRRTLEGEGIGFVGESDTEVLLRLYLTRGERMLGLLNGIFAFAIYHRSRDAVLIARDGMGVKPLYVHAGDGTFLFASEIKALLPLGATLGPIDPVAVHRYLTYLWCPGDATPFSGVRALGPGEAMWVAGAVVERHWSWLKPAVRVSPKGARPMGAREAVEGVTAQLRAAVQRQLVADVPVGAFLSGGLDSSAIVTFAREAQPDITCFSIDTSGGPDGVPSSDLPYARRVAEHLGVDLEVVEVAPEDMMRDLVMMVEQLDEPLADPASLNVWYMARQARRMGVKVLLSGAGGDDLLSGYRRHLALRFEPIWRWLPVSVRLGIRRAVLGLDKRRALVRRVARLVADVDLDGDERLASYFAWARHDEIAQLYTAAFRARLGNGRADTPMLEHLERLDVSVSPLERMLALEQRFYLPDHNLIYNDKMSMKASVEVRVPFLDDEFVAFARRIPMRYKQRGRVSKWVLKQAMEAYLPAEILHRPKVGFEVPLRTWIRGPLRPFVLDLLSAERLRDRGIFDWRAVHTLIDDDASGRRDAAFTVFALMCVELWCRRFLDGAPATQDAL